MLFGGVKKGYVRLMDSQGSAQQVILFQFGYTLALSPSSGI